MLVDLGLDPYSIDTVIAGFGMPMGPFRCGGPPAAPLALALLIRQPNSMWAEG